MASKPIVRASIRPHQAIEPSARISRFILTKSSIQTSSLDNMMIDAKAFVSFLGSASLRIVHQLLFSSSKQSECCRALTMIPALVDWGGEDEKTRQVDIIT